MSTIGHTGVRGPVTALAGWEFRSAVRSKWVFGTALAFAALALGVTLLGLRSIRELGLTGAGPTSSSLVNLGVLLPSLMGLLLGAGHLSASRDSGMLAMISAQPISRRSIVLGTFTGLAGSMWATVGVGFGVAALVISGVADSSEIGPLIALIAATLAMAAVAVAIGIAISTVASSRTQALAAAVIVWLLLAFAIDLVFATLASTLHLGAGALLATVLVNPLEAARVLALLATSADGTALGPFGAYLLDRFGTRGATAVLVADLMVWTVLPLSIGVWVLRRRDA